MSDDRPTQTGWPLVEVKWVDSCGPHGWTRLRDVLGHSVSRCVSVGYLVRDEADQKTLVAHVDMCDGDLGGSNVDGVIHIPTVAILSCRVIEASSDMNGVKND